MQEIYCWRTDVVFFPMTNIKTIVCSSSPLTIEIRGKLKSQQRTKRAEKLHKDAQPVIVPTDAFKLQISAQNKAPRLVCW